MELGIRDRVVLVTGAGRGIGRQICQTLAEDGVRVAVNDLFQERADESAGEISRSGGKAIGVLFSGSGPEQWARTMGLITQGVLNCSRAVIEGMSERRWGRIISIISD